MSIMIRRIPARLKQLQTHTKNDQKIAKIAKKIDQQVVKNNKQPVVFFNSSTRLKGMSLNAAFSLLTAWAIKLQGIPVYQFICDSGMSRCMLGSILNKPLDPPPCSTCISQSQKFYKYFENRFFKFEPAPELIAKLKDLTVSELSIFKYGDVPYGEIVLPAIRWVLRRYHLLDDDETRILFQSYIISAENVARHFLALLHELNPQKIIVFNGMSYPEATVRWIALQHKIQVITHEVGLQPFSAFFSYDHATAYPIQLDPDFQLSKHQNQKLDQYLQQRFSGNFSMAGIKFWPSMKELSPSFLEFSSKFKQIVPVFTNVIFDTSQSHANVLFTHMYDWLDCVLEIIKSHPETLFVIRAHPDEARPGKASVENVANWTKLNRIDAYENVVFVDATERFSSYELIQKSKFVMIYNSTIGMEATLMGVPVISGGKSRFTQIPIVYLPESKKAFVDKVEMFLNNEDLQVPEEFMINVRRFLYTQLYKVSLPFDEFIEEDGVWNGYVKIKDFTWEKLLPENSLTINALVGGILNNRPFEIDQ